MTPTQRVCLRLDRGIVLERLILNHMATLSANRAQDWLRSLLAQGFLVESRILHATGASAGPDPRADQTGSRDAMTGSTFARWLADEGQRRAPRAAPAAAIRREAPLPVTGGASKPFAALRKVVG